MLLLSAFQTLLYRYTGQEDILIGSPAMGRPLDFYEVVGYFVNPLVLRARLSGELKFSTLLRQTRQTVLSALRHQDFPFALLVERLQPDRDPARSPLFQVMFSMWPAEWSQALSELSSNAKEREVWAGLSLELFQISQQEGQFDLILEMREADGCFWGEFKYNTDLFKTTTIKRIAAHWQILLSGIVDNPGQRIAELPLLSETERQQLLVEWNDTETSYPQDQAIHHLFEAQVARTPEATALVFGEQRLTYRELDSRANQLAHYLQGTGVGPETRVGLYVERSPDMIIGLLAILKAGGAYVPLDPTYPQTRLNFMIEDAGISILLTQAGLLIKHKTIQVCCLDSDWPAIAQTGDGRTAPVSQVRPDNLAYVIYTSGSTGRPKGVMVTHRSLVNLALAQIEAFELGPESRVLQFAPFSFDASVSEIFTTLLAGATLYLAPPEQLLPGPPLWELLRSQAITTVTLPPSILAALPFDPLPAMRTLVSAGEPCPVDLVARWAPGRRFLNAYGPTETTVCATIAICSGAEDRPPPIGRPIANTQVYILDDFMQPLPVGVPGMLYVGGVSVARGYLNRPDLTAERFLPNPLSPYHLPPTSLYKTGDLARYLPDGNIEFLGRLDHQVKLRGYRIELGEIEACLREQPGIRAAVVAVRESPNGHQQLVAYLVAAPGHKPDTGRMGQYVAQKLPSYMVPARYVFLPELPRTTNGKLNRQALPSPQRDRPVQSVAYQSPQTAMEKQLVAIWSEVLSLEQIGIHDNFFELGGHSLHVVQIQIRLVDQLQREIPIVTLFQYPTIKALAQHLTTAEQGESNSDRTAAEDRAKQLQEGKDRLKTRLKRRLK